MEWEQTLGGAVVEQVKTKVTVGELWVQSPSLPKLFFFSVPVLAGGCLSSAALFLITGAWG